MTKFGRIRTNFLDENLFFIFSAYKVTQNGEDFTSPVFS